MVFGKSHSYSLAGFVCVGAPTQAAAEVSYRSLVDRFIRNSFRKWAREMRVALVVWPYVYLISNTDHATDASDFCIRFAASQFPHFISVSFLCENG